MRRKADIDYSRAHDLTIAEVRACPAFAHFTDEEIKEAIETLKAFSKIVFDYYKKSAQDDGK